METTSTIQTSPGILRRKSTFFLLFGVSAAAFAAGFEDCLFMIDKADACVGHAESWIGRFQEVGDHLIQWGIAIVKAAFT